MLEKLKRGRQNYGLARYLRRAVTAEVNRIFYSVDRASMANTFRAVGLEPGAVVCVHSALSRLGYVRGGEEAVIDAVLDVIGPSGCLLMPGFSTGGFMADYIRSNAVFEVNRTPSLGGAVTEAFRRRPDVQRSAHPTNSVLACGRGAEEILKDHQHSLTPYGFKTPYGRLVERDDTFILMLETHVQSLLHHIQERVDFPNMFLPETATAVYVDRNENRQTMTTRLMRPRAIYFVAVPSATGEKPDWATLHDFSLLFPSFRNRLLAERGIRFEGYPKIFQRRQEFEKSGILRSGKLGRGEIGLLRVKRFVAEIEPEFRDMINRYKSWYDPEILSTFKLY
jgi:aminoglycoside 3-N-acetyltransferase